MGAAPAVETGAHVTVDEQKLLAHLEIREPLAEFHDPFLVLVGTVEFLAGGHVMTDEVGRDDVVDQVQVAGVVRVDEGSADARCDVPSGLCGCHD